jgi:transcriptional regulator with XRE-family HTH domain
MCEFVCGWIKAHDMPVSDPKNNQDVQPQKSFGQRVNELCDGQGTTQKDLADAANLFRICPGRIETGLENPSLTVIHALALALSKSPGELLQPLALDY